MCLNKVFVWFAFFLSTFCFSIKSYATHIFGGELLYRYVSGNSYILTLTLYGDCSAAAASALPGATPKIYIYRDNVQVDAINLSLSDGDVEVSPVCPGMLDKTTCHPGGTLPGVKKFVYSDTVDLPSTSANWRFIFSGNLGVSGNAGRSQNITNAGTSTMQIEAALNNLTSFNSSPEYSTIPTPFYCLLDDQQYNQGAIDPDGDSLVYSLVPATNGNVNNPSFSGAVSYNSPYTGEEPLATDTGKFVFSVINGQLTFTPNSVQNALVVCQVSEYRGGVLVGTSQREMTFIVAADCEGTPPSLKVVNVTGGAITGKNVINICVGTPSVSFGISVSNPDKDTTYLTSRNVPESAILSIVKNNTPNPTIYFSWANTDTVRPGAYTFFIDVKNNHCPISNRQTIAYTINVTPYPTVSSKIVSPTFCVQKALVQHNLALGYIPRIVTVSNGADINYTYKDTTGIVVDSLPVGSYTIIASCSPLCTVTDRLVVVDSGVLPLSPVIETYCQRDMETPLKIPVQSSASVLTWYDTNGNVLPGAPTPSTSVPGTYKWLVSEHYKVCTSDRVSAEAIIYPLPIPKILTNPLTVCFGDTLLLEASGGVRYIWTPEDRVLMTADSTPYTRMTTPGKFTVKAITDHGCIDSTSVTFSKVGSCCIFSYPSAFTPNNDGRNDGFRVLTPGNLYNYKLAVYNRWGQLVFLSYVPDKYWDGQQYGEPCEPGTYYYFFEATCLTGMVEKHQGDVTLIR
jgi:gliding motility-associated-like protein